MSFFNLSTVGSNKTMNSANGSAYKQTPKKELFNLVVNSFGYDGFYESSTERFKRLEELVCKCDPEYVAKLAVYTRTKMHMRTMPMAMLVLLAKHFSGSQFIRLATRNTITRADELSEVLAAYQAINGRSGVKKLNKLNNGLRRGIADAFYKFDEYQFGKYKNSSKDVSLKDAYFVSHPKPRNDQDRELFGKIINDSLEIPFTWETQLSEIGQKDITDEEKCQQRVALWEKLIFTRKIGYMALLRNLRNIIKDGVDDGVINTIVDIIQDPDQVKKSKQLPFRFFSAYVSLKEYFDEISSDNKSITTISLGGKSRRTNVFNKLADALEKAAMCAVSNIPGFENERERILIACDVSGSMEAKISNKSDITYKIVGLLMSLLVYKARKDSSYILFADTIGSCENMEGINVLECVDRLRNFKELGYSTYGYKVVEYILQNQISYDKVMFFTDMQLYGSDISKIWNLYLHHVNKECKAIIFNLAGYGCPFINDGNNCVTVGGLAENAFKLLYAVENGEKLMSEIESVELK